MIQLMQPMQMHCDFYNGANRNIETDQVASVFSLWSRHYAYAFSCFAFNYLIININIISAEWAMMYQIAVYHPESNKRTYCMFSSVLCIGWCGSLHWNNRPEQNLVRLSHGVNIRLGIGWLLRAEKGQTQSSAFYIFYPWWLHLVADT